MLRTLGFAALAALVLVVVGSHELLLARHGQSHGTQCPGPPPIECGPGSRFSRQTCECVPTGANKELVCHLETVEIVDPDTGEVTTEVVGTVINVSVESAHIRKGKHGDCAPEDNAVEGDSCTCDSTVP